MDVGGQDATEAFEDVGHSDEAREILDGLLVGTLKRAVRSPLTLSLILRYSTPISLASPVNCIRSTFLPSHSMPMSPRANVPTSPATQRPKPKPPNPQPAPPHPTARVSASVSTPSSSSAAPSPSARTNTCRCRARIRNEVSSPHYQPDQKRKVNRQVGGEGETQIDFQ